MKRLILMLPIFAAACQSAPTTTIVRVETTPAGAVLSIAGFGECETPCTIEVDREREAQIAKAGFKPQKVVLKPGAKTLAVTLELAAPTTSVDETSIPEI